MKIPRKLQGHPLQMVAKHPVSTSWRIFVIIKQLEKLYEADRDQYEFLLFYPFPITKGKKKSSVLND